LTDASSVELLANAQIAGATVMSTRLRAEVIQGLQGPVVVPPGNVEAQARAAAAAAGYNKGIFYNWDWAKTNNQFVQTIDDSQGPLGPAGVVIIAFVPQSVLPTNGSVSVSEFPGGLGVKRQTSIRTTPCDFSGVVPDYNQGMQFTVAPTVIRPLQQLIVGTQYFLSIANYWPGGIMPPGNQPEMRVSASRPPLS